MNGSALEIPGGVGEALPGADGARAPAGAPLGVPVPAADTDRDARPVTSAAAIAVPAGFWVRAVAIGVDYVLVLALQFVVGFVLGLGTAAAGVTLTESDVDAVGFVFGGATLVAYFTLFTGALGRTPGKKIFDLEVVRTDGSRITTARAFCRTMAYVLSSLFWGLGFVWAGFDARKQAWHDKVCGTLVVHSAGRGQS